MLKQKMLLVLSAILFFIAEVPAGPANPFPQEVKQADGSVVTIVGRGDEFFNWTESSDGYVVAFDNNTKNWTYAYIDDNKIVPSSSILGGGSTNNSSNAPSPAPVQRIRATDLRPLIDKANTSRNRKGSSGYLQQSAPNIASNQNVTAVSPAPLTNMNPSLLVILLEYNDAEMVKNNDYWYDHFFGNSQGQLNHYFSEVSGGKFQYKNLMKNDDFSGTLPSGVSSITIHSNGIAKVKLDKAHPPYVNNVPGSNTNAIKNDLNTAFNAIKSYFDFTPFANNLLDGFIKSRDLSVYSVVAGFEASGATQYDISRNYTQRVWAHANLLSVSNEIISVRYSDLELQAHAIQGEIYKGKQKMGSVDTVMGIGVTAHELGHILGLPDLYDTEKISDGIGPYSLMSSGSWGAGENEIKGYRPTHLDAWSKIALGFVTPIEVTYNSNWKNNLHTINSADNYNILKITNNTADSKQYFLLENRGVSGYDGGFYVSGINAQNNNHGGILIYHIDESVTDDWGRFGNTNWKRRGVAVEPADGSNTMDFDGSDYNNNNHFFSNTEYKGNINGAFNPVTTPNSKFYNSNYGTSFKESNISIKINSVRSSVMEIETKAYFVPTVVTQVATDITQTTVMLNKTVTEGTETLTEQGFEYKVLGVATWTKITTSEETYNLTGLAANKTYLFRAYASAEDGATYGGTRTFTTSTGVTGIAIDESNFPDANFRAWSLAQHWGIDEVITSYEIAGIENINISFMAISDLKGIEYFTSLKGLYCHGNQLTSLDVSNSTELIDLNCAFNKLDLLDVSKNTALATLYCQGNQLTCLDLSKNTELIDLYCHANQLISLDASKNLSIKNLMCSENQLNSLDVSKNTKLEFLHVAENQLNSLDVSKNTALKELYCHGNQLSEIDLTGLSKLSDFSGQNQKISLTLSGFGSNYSADIVLNNLVYLSNGITYTNGKVISNSQNIDFSEFVAVATGFEDKYILGTLKFNYITDGIAINATNFPDANFRNWILNQPWSVNEFITSAEIETITSIDVSDKNIVNLKGIEHFIRLEDLNCSQNQLTSIDVSNNPELRFLTCFLNQLTSLDVSNNTGLWVLDVSGNNLSSLDVSNNEELHTLWCELNKIESIKLPENPVLQRLAVSDNRLISLDLSNVNLRGISFKNPFKGHNQTPSIITLSGFGNSYSYEIELDNPIFDDAGITYENGKIVSSNKNITSTTFNVDAGNYNLSGTLNFVYEEKIETFTVVFMYGIIPDSVKVAKDDIVAEPTAPIKEGFGFAGWLNDGEKFDFLTPITEDLILVAKFEPDATPITDEPKEDFCGIKLSKNIVIDKVEINVILPKKEKSAETKVVIYDMTGNVVFVGVTAPDHPLIWDLTNNVGRIVANGTYLIVAEVKGMKNIYHYSAKLGVKK